MFYGKRRKQKQKFKMKISRNQFFTTIFGGFLGVLGYKTIKNNEANHRILKIAEIDKKMQVSTKNLCESLERKHKIVLYEDAHLPYLGPNSPYPFIK